MSSTRRNSTNTPGTTTIARNANMPSRLLRLGLTERDDTLLRVVHAFHFLTAEQVLRLFYCAGSLTYVRAVLKRMADAGYLHRLKLPSSSDGVKPWVYTLGQHGIRYLKAVGYTDFARFRPVEEEEHSFLFLAHTLGVNDILIAAQQLAEQMPSYVLAGFLHERVLKHTPVIVTTADGETMGIIPDAWLDWHLGGVNRASIVLEYDRGTVEQRAWRKKMRGLLAFADGPYQEAYGSDSLTIAIATTAGPHRAEQIRVWCEAELTRANRRQEGELFLIMSVPSEQIEPQVFFLHPVWWQPFGTAPVVLLSDENPLSGP